MSIVYLTLSKERNMNAMYIPTLLVFSLNTGNHNRRKANSISQGAAA